MKRHISLSRFLHNDKLMLVVSLILGIVIWAIVVYGPGNTEDRVITGVPVSVTLSEYATETVNLRIVSEEAPTATVKVHGVRSVISKLTAADISVTADTTSITKEGTYTLALRAAANGDYTIQSVVGNNGNNSTVSITCDVWKESTFAVTGEIPNITVAADADDKLQLGIPVVSGVGVENGSVTVSGPKTDVGRITQVVAQVQDTASLKDTASFAANLVALDESQTAITTVSFADTEGGSVTVTVPVLVYREVDLTPSAKNVPKAFQNVRPLVTVSPDTLELWGVTAEAEDYIQDVKERICIDFDNLNPDSLSRTFVLDPVGTVRPVNGSEEINVDVALKNMSTRTVDLTLNSSNFQVNNCPAGYSVKLAQTKITGITLCGPATALSALSIADLSAVVDLSGVNAAGTQTLSARIQVKGADNVWVYYGMEGSGVDVLANIVKN